MMITVGRVKLASVTALIGLVLCGLYAHLAQRTDTAVAALASAWSVHLAASCAATVLSFAAFPVTRRADLARAVVMALLLLEIGDRLMFGEWRLADMAADAAGGYGVFAVSCLERLRGLMRNAPGTPFSIVYPGDRRRRRSEPATAARPR